MAQEVYMFDDEKIESLIKENKLKNMDDVNSLVKKFSKKVIETMLQHEISEHLGYDKHDYSSKKTSNSRNGFSTKKVKSELGQIELKVPRDRQDEFEPIIVRKGCNTISGLDEKILMMYARGMSERDIADFIKETYNYKLSAQTVSNIIGEITGDVRTWQNRSLEPLYAIVYLDAIVYKVKVDGIIKNTAIYSLLGVDIEGNKDIIGLWVGDNESSTYWFKLLTNLKSRGVEDILICCVDGLKGFSKAINAVYPNTDVQRCIVHQVRNSLKIISYKNRQAVANDLKLIYKAHSEEAARDELNRFSEKWDTKYPHISKSWINNWTELSTFFKYPVEIRKMIYTTNTIENYHRSLRRITKSKPVFPTEISLMRLLYLVTKNVVKKWRAKAYNWGIIYSQLSIIFEERLEKYKILK